MACTGITDILVRESGRISKEIHDRNFATDPWDHMTPKAEWPEGEGEIISNLTYERTAPQVANPTWTAVSVVDGAEGGACLPSATRISIGSTTRTFGLKRSVLEGPDFCAEEARSVFALNSQLDSIINVLAGYTKLQWMMRHSHEYARLAGKKVVVTSSALTESTTEDYAAADATGILTQGVLDTYSIDLQRDGAGQSALGYEDGRPVMTLMIGAEQSRNLLAQDAEARDDLRWGEPGELLKKIGVRRSYRGFFHVIIPYPRRFSYSGGTYTEIAPFDEEAATKGNKAKVRDAWKTATYEETVIFDPTVLRCRIPRPITNPHSKFNFDPVTYNGDWKVKNIPDRVCNPDGNIIYHRGILASGSEPWHPERGVVFVHKRCAVPQGLTATCPTT
jgi:hypothetical protein